MSKPFRFGVQSFNADSAEDWAGQVQPFTSRTTYSEQAQLWKKPIIPNRT